MSLKTSFFNKSLLKSDIKRFWWVGLMEMLIIFISVVFPIYNNCKRAIDLGRESYFYTEPTWMTGAIIIIMVFAVGVATLLLSYMHSSASMSTHHSLPFKRCALLISKFASGALLTIAPILINAILLGLILINPEYRRFYSVVEVLKWTVSGIIYTGVFYTLTSFVNMMTGNPIGTLVFTSGFMALPLIITGFFEMFFSQEVYGYTSNSIEYILNYIYVEESQLFTFGPLAVYICFIVLFTLGAFSLYKHRKLEAHGEVIAFLWLKPVFIGIIGLLSSMVSYLYFRGVLNKNGLLYILPLGILGVIIAWMISRKRISPKGIHKPVIIYVAAALAFCAVIHFDLTGYERRIPHKDDIVSVSITHDVPLGQIWIGDRAVDYRIKDRISPYFTEEKDIVNVIDFHNYMLENRADRTYNNFFTIPLTYKLKNGKTILRTYDVQPDKDAKVLKPLYETKQMKATRFPIADGAEKEFERLIISDRRFKDNQIVIYPDNDAFMAIVEALKKDIEALPYEEFMIHNNASAAITVEYRNKLIYNEEVPTEYINDHNKNYDRYQIRSSYKNTLRVLKELGYFEGIESASSIEGATISTWESNGEKADLGYSYGPEPESEVKNAKVTSTTDASEISTLYCLYDSMIEFKKFTNFNTRYNIKIGYRLKSGHVFEVSCSYDEDKIPSEFKKYF